MEQTQLRAPHLIKPLINRQAQLKAELGQSSNHKNLQHSLRKR